MTESISTKNIDDEPLEILTHRFAELEKKVDEIHSMLLGLVESKLKTKQKT